MPSIELPVVKKLAIAVVFVTGSLSTKRLTVDAFADPTSKRMADAKLEVDLSFMGILHH